MKRKLNPLEIIIVAAPLLMVGAALLPVAALPRWSRVMGGTCMTNLKQIARCSDVYPRLR
jgi:hypothetical protein